MESSLCEGKDLVKCSEHYRHLSKARLLFAVVSLAHGCSVNPNLKEVKSSSSQCQDLFFSLIFLVGFSRLAPHIKESKKTEFQYLSNQK